MMTALLIFAAFLSIAAGFYLIMRKLDRTIFRRGKTVMGFHSRSEKGKESDLRVVYVDENADE